MLVLSGNQGWVRHAPDFLWSLLALMRFTRLLLMKAALVPVGAPDFTGCEETHVLYQGTTLVVP